MFKYALLLCCLLSLSACFLHKKSAKAKETKAAAKAPRLHTGMTRDEALAVVTDRSELLMAEFNYPRGHLAVYQYTRYGKPLSDGAGYYLYFMNDTLIRKSAPEPLRRGARIAIGDYYEKEQE